MDKSSEGTSISPKKLEANRRNAQRSTGPRTEEGKSQSRCNALKHGILASALLITKGSAAEDSAEFEGLMGGLRRDLAPVGALEEMLVEKIAVCWWRQKRALRYEAGLVRKQMTAAVREAARLAVMSPLPIEDKELDDDHGIDEDVFSPEELAGLQTFSEDLEVNTDDLRLPRIAQLDLILRYETSVQRQLVHAINQLERLQRARKGELVPAPVSVQVSSDQ